VHLLKHLYIRAIAAGFFITFLIDLVLNSLFGSFNDPGNIHWYISVFFGGIVTGFLAKRGGFLNGMIAIGLLVLLADFSSLSANLYALMTVDPEFRRSVLFEVQTMFSTSSIFQGIRDAMLGGICGILGQLIYKYSNSS